MEGQRFRGGGSEVPQGRVSGSEGEGHRFRGGGSEIPRVRVRGSAGESQRFSGGGSGSGGSEVEEAGGMGEGRGVQ